MPMLTIALVGNPNSGKSTIFNALTGAQQHVGNWPGVTVEKKEGITEISGQKMTVFDLPGAYALSTYSAEEGITRDFILENKPDVVVAVVDAANLERNLYLVVLLLEMGAPLLMALNMTDVAERRNININIQKLSQKLGGIPIIPTVGSREVGIDGLKQSITQCIEQRPKYNLSIVDFDASTENEIKLLQSVIDSDASSNGKYPSRWLATVLLEDDGEMKRRFASNTALMSAVENSIVTIQDTTDETPDILIAGERYKFVAGLVKDAVTRPSGDNLTTSDKMDRILAHRIWGIPIFLFFMWIVFQVTTNASAPFLDWIDGLVNGPVSRWASSLLGVLGLGETWVEALVIDGVIASVGGVMVFVPVLLFLYLALAILEETGYMARAAYVMERFMHRLGLHGKSFLPLIVGFGCTVPGIYATRTLEDETDRKITGFITPFMSCGARLPVYVIFGTAFFGAQSGNLVFAMYLLGILVAILTSLLLTRGIFRNREVNPFVIELPAYHLPNYKMLWLYVSRRVWIFIRNAGTIIFAASVVIWFLTAIPAVANGTKFAEVDSKDSVFGKISGLIAPVLAPAGFGTWEASSSLMTGLLAKEVIISTMSQLYVGEEEEQEPGPKPTFADDVAEITVSFGKATVLTAQEFVNIIPRTVNVLPGVNLTDANFLGDDGPDDADISLEIELQKAFTPLQAVAFNVFVLLYIPCMATIAAMRHEFGTRWMLYQSTYMIAVAWIASVIVYQGGLLLNLG